MSYDNKKAMVLSQSHAPLLQCVLILYYHWKDLLYNGDKKSERVFVQSLQA